MQDLQAAVVDNREVAEDFYLARLEAPPIAAAARPGQFVEVKSSGRMDPFLRMPLSICAVDKDSGTVDLLYEDMGPKSHLLSRAVPGDVIDCMGPLGRGFTAPLAGYRAVAVGGGIGVPPLLFWGRRLKADGVPTTLLVGARSASKHLPEALLGDAADRVGQATDDGSLGQRGFVTELLEAELEAGGPVQVYTCGPHGMMAAVAAVCDKADVPCQASLEEYMACGYGVCVGCVVEVRPEDGQQAPPYYKYSRVCVEGPVFDAHRVVWGT